MPSIPHLAGRADDISASTLYSDELSDIEGLKMRKTVVFVITLLILPIMAAAQERASEGVSPETASIAPAAQSSPGLHSRAPRYKLRRGDSFELQFAFSPEFNQTVTVQPDGYITLKAVDSVIAEGKTIPELTATIEHSYAGILHEPVVTVDLKDFDKPFFFVTGEVGKPGKYDIRTDLTVMEGVAVAGGFIRSSKHSQVVLFRPGDNGLTEARLINLKKMLNGRNLTEDVQLRAGDMIYVPKNQLSKIDRYLPTTSLGMYAYPGAF